MTLFEEELELFAPENLATLDSTLERANPDRSSHGEDSGMFSLTDTKPTTPYKYRKGASFGSKYSC